MKYDVYYMKPDFFSAFIWGDKKPELAALDKTHTLLKSELERPDMEAVFTYMQGENWSPNGEARPLIERLGLKHTSMSVGDVLRDCWTGEYYVVASFGFDKL